MPSLGEIEKRYASALRVIVPVWQLGGSKCTANGHQCEHLLTGTVRTCNWFGHAIPEDSERPRECIDGEASVPTVRRRR
jgi:hypothetical protein